MREILTDTSAGAQDFFGCSSYGGGFRIETEVFIDYRGQIQQCFGQGAGRRKRRGCIGGEGGLRGDARRLKYELVGIEAGFAYIGFERSNYLVPRGRVVRPCYRRTVDYYATTRYDVQFFMGFADGEKSKSV